jgi:hypothetical protein
MAIYIENDEVVAAGCRQSRPDKRRPLRVVGPDAPADFRTRIVQGLVLGLSAKERVAPAAGDDDFDRPETRLILKDCPICDDFVSIRRSSVRDWQDQANAPRAHRNR